jgi:hypothetical protein
VKPCEWVRETLAGESFESIDAVDAAACREHLAACVACSVEIQVMREISGALRAVEAFPREREVDWDRFARDTVRRAMVDPAPAWGAGWAARLRQALSHAFSHMKTAPRGGWSPARVAWGGAAALVLTAGVAIVSIVTVMTPAPGRQAPMGQQAAAAVPVAMSEGGIDTLTVNLARQNTARYLNETRAVLVTLLDVGIDCDKDKVDVSAERAKATELLRRQRLIAAELNRVPLARAQDVCNELERLLVEISTLADCARDEELQTLRDVVEKRQILVRMELLSAELARREASRA